MTKQAQEVIQAVQKAAYRFYVQGIPIEQIADALDTDADTVRQWTEKLQNNLMDGETVCEIAESVTICKASGVR